ncbi:MAG: response regulator [Candidatus Obscuribacterales bacterium]|nr:response regulator [Candidatus Obscuribacterales bacterium]
MGNQIIEIEKVMLVDDDPLIRSMAGICLQGLSDWNLVLCQSAAEALQKFEEDIPDLLLLDLLMPEMGGLELYKIIKEKLGEKSPVLIFMTARIEAQELEEYKKIGAAGLIMKPFDPMKLVEKIENILIELK